MTSSRIGFGLKRYQRAILLIFLSFLLSLVGWFADRASLGLQLSTYLFSAGYLANTIPVVILFGLSLAISNRAGFSFLLTGSILILISVANSIKLSTLQQPIVFGDIYFLRGLDASIISLLAHYISTKVLGACAAALATLAIVAAKEPPFLGGSRWLRLNFLLLVLLAGVSLFHGVWPVRSLYAQERLRLTPWWPATSQLHAGVLGTFAYGAIESSRAWGGTADEAAIDRLSDLDAGPKQHPRLRGSSEKPDIIVIQSESFFDPAILADVEDTGLLLPNLHQAESAGTSGGMAVPTFGGGTLRTEFEILTSIPLSTFPDVVFPYLQIQSTSMPSLPRVLADMGYETIAVHPNSGTFWNREKTFAAMGFDRFYSIKDFPPKSAHDGWSLADSAFTDKLIAVLNKSERRPVFIMGISMEGHGPYADSAVADQASRNAIPAPDKWNGKATSEYRDYVYHIKHADQQLGRLWQFLKGRQKPYILVFYGDHLPGFKNVYAASGFDNGKSAPSQRVPWVMVGTHVPPGTKASLYSWMLGGEVLCELTDKLPPYYAMLHHAQTYQRSLRSQTLDEGAYAGVRSLARLYFRGENFPPHASERAHLLSCQ